MPKYNNHFASPIFEEHEIRDEANDLVDFLRVKPSSILWKPKGKHTYTSVPLERFAAWIMSDGAGGKQVKQ